MRSAAMLALLLHACVNAAHPSMSPSSSPESTQPDLCSANTVESMRSAQCVETADFYREIAYDIAADIAQRSSESRCSAIKGCSRGIHWHVPAPKGGCRHDVSYDDLVKALEAHLHSRMDSAVCQAECARLVSPDGWDLHVLFGTMKAAVHGQVSIQPLALMGLESY